MQCYRKSDEIFHLYALEKGLADSSFWVLYTLCEAKTPLTQNDLCAMWYLPKQTIHSAVASLVKMGYVTLEHAPGSRNRKHILLTSDGRDYTNHHILPILEAERRAFAGLDAEERRLACALIQKYLALFRQETANLFPRQGNC